MVDAADPLLTDASLNTVLATAHAVSEGIIRGVNTEMQRRSMPNTYTANGRRSAPGPRNNAPFAVSRSL